jgi:uncharacterized protein DUF992
MKSLIRVSVAAAIVCFLLFPPMQGSASAQGTVNTGILTCHVAGGFGYILGSTRTMNCTFRPNSGSEEYYHGSMSTFGADIGYLATSSIVWAVLAPSGSSTQGALAGTYGGVSARAAILGGAGVNALVGGFGHSIALQPVSVEGNTGLYIGGGLGVMNLEAGDLEY